MAEVILKDIVKIYPYVERREKPKKGEPEKKKINLQITDKGVVAVQQFNLAIKDKEFVVLVGPSGCGKSTTLRMIAGLEDITSGELYIDGNLMNAVEPKDRDIAMVFQSYALYPHMTVYQNMAYSLKIKKIPMAPTSEAILEAEEKLKAAKEYAEANGQNVESLSVDPVVKYRHYTKKEIDQKVREAAETLDITELLNRKPKNLSGGQRQRVAIGRAIVRNPKALLMDEPLSNLDAKLRNLMRAELIKLRAKINTTFIYVTHDQVEAMTLGDRIVVMKDGFIQQIGTPQEVFDHPRNLFVSGFIGTPQMNYFYAKLLEDNGKYSIQYCGKDVNQSKQLDYELGSYYIFPNRREINFTNIVYEEDKIFDVTTGEPVELVKEQLIMKEGKYTYYSDMIELTAKNISKENDKVIYDDGKKKYALPANKTVVKDGVYYLLSDKDKVTVDKDKIYEAEGVSFIIGGTHVYDISDEKQKRLAKNKIKAQNIILGVRPDHMSVSEKGIKGLVEVSELMGTSAHLHLDIDGSQAVCIVQNNGTLADYMGKVISLDFNGNVVHLFDPTTTKNLEYVNEDFYYTKMF